MNSSSQVSLFHTCIPSSPLWFLAICCPTFRGFKIYSPKALLAVALVLQMLVLPCLVAVAGMAGAVASAPASVIPRTSVSTVFASPSSTELLYFEPSSTVDILRAPSETHIVYIDYQSTYNISIAHTNSSTFYTSNNTVLDTLCSYPISVTTSTYVNARC